ncbi:MAG: hydrogenase [Oligoflexia bacterium]|nr:hydrogenase [Oligoflexia bacterium]MBF0364230.1 hydrogenase [Oligoflexia bacterium]
MLWFIIALILLIVSSLLSLLYGKTKICTIVINTALASSMIGIILFYNNPNSSNLELTLPWTIWHQPLIFSIDALSAFFLIPITLLSLLATIFFHGYSKHIKQERLYTLWFFYPLFLCSMIMVILSKSSLLFLLSWEMMSLSSFALVIFEYEKKHNLHAGWLYLTLTQVGTVFLIIHFVLISDPVVAREKHLFLSFITALIGFGTKAGIMPLHTWLPEAHPAAPSPISALMSGVMIKTGIYGIIRATLTLSPHIPIYFGEVILILGIISGVGGVLLALSQHDLKRLLAYHSVENIGIICIGMGIGLIGASTQNSLLFVFGFSGALLHVINHALFKGLLFLGAGSIITSTKEKLIDRLGGLIKFMPITALTFTIGAISISGIPPFNGFVSEFFIYYGTLKSLTGHFSGLNQWLIAAIITVLSLALIGGLALLCFAKVVGVVFLGEQRSHHLEVAREKEISILLPMIILAFLCVTIGICPTIVIPILSTPILFLSSKLSLTPIDLNALLGGFAVLGNLVHFFAFFLLLLTFMILLRLFLHSKRKTDIALTWDCGHHEPTAKMQYTASSFAVSTIDFFKFLLPSKRKLSIKKSPLHRPIRAHYHFHTYDIADSLLLRPFYLGVILPLKKGLSFQHGKISGYILYMFLCLLALITFSISY